MMRSSIPSEPDDEARKRREEVVAAVTRHRHALRVGDASGVGRTLDAHARLPSERDLLVDLVAAEGLEPATRKLSRFWRGARSQVDAVRIVGPDEAEVYEQLWMPPRNSPIETVTLLRRGRDATWRIVTTQRAPADDVRVQIWPEAGTEVRDDSFTRAFHRRYGPDGELVMDDHEGVLGHPAKEWVGALRVPRTEGQPFELALVGDHDPEVRLTQVHWLSRCAVVVASLLGAERAYVPLARKLVSVESLEAVAQPEAPGARHVAAAWVALHRTGETLFSKGMSTFAHAEVVAHTHLWEEAGVARRVAGAAVHAGLSGAMDLVPGELVHIARRRVLVESGPRGPTSHDSFGRWGAVELVPLSDTVGSSGVVRRVT